MPDIRVNTSAYSIKVQADTVTDIATSGTDVKGVTGFSVEDNSTYRSIRALGDAGAGVWQKMVRETLGITITLTVDHLVDDTTGALEAGQAILATAAQGTTTAAGKNIVGVQFTSPGTGNLTTGLFSVHGGTLGLGSGGSDGSFNTATYRLVSHGEITRT